MPSRRLRTALAAALATPLLVAPLAQAGSAPLTCRGVEQTGSWQRLPVDFTPTPGVRTSGVLSAYSVDALRPQRVLATNGNAVLVSDSHGCAFGEGVVLGAEPTAQVPLSGVTSTIVATASLTGGPSLALVREGSGAASRPHVLRSGDDRPGSWAISDDGLPLQGSPRLLEPAGDGRTAYVALTPAGDAGGDGGALPTLPGGGSTAPAGLLYATVDGGRSWQLRTPADALPGGVTGLDALAVDPADPDLLYALSAGRLVVSEDGGRTLSLREGVSGATAIEPMEPREAAVLLGGGRLLHSKDAFVSFAERPAPARAGSAAYRTGDDALVVEAEGRLVRVDARGTSRSSVLDAGAPVTRGSARGDRAANGSFHATSGNALLRYVDPGPQGSADQPRDLGDLGTPPPPPGQVLPPSRSVELAVGQSRALDFTLALPESPTPLDVYLLIDTTLSMRNLLKDVQDNLLTVTDAISADGVDLRVGVGTIGIGPRPGEAPYPEADPSVRDYRKPVPYTRVRAVGEVNRDLVEAVRGIRLVTPPRDRGNEQAEGQLIALEQLVTGEGVQDERSVEALPTYAVAPRQKAGFREAPGIRRIVVHATNGAFGDPYGTRLAGGRPDVGGVAGLLAEADIQHVGLTVQENARSKPDLRLVSEVTDTVAPAGGLDCGDNVQLAPGDPMVCDSTRNFSAVMTRLVRSLADRQSVTLAPRGRSTVLGAVEAPGLQDLDVTVPNRRDFRVRVSCVDVAPGRYVQDVDAVMRGTRVATARVEVTCTPVAAAAVAPPAPQPPPIQEPAPPAQPVAQAPAAPAPAPPVVQAQTQPQAQVQSQLQAQTQVQPLTAAALQQQEELQLALALLADQAPAARSELAMVDRRRDEGRRSVALLAVSLAIASVFGLAAADRPDAGRKVQVKLICEPCREQEHERCPGKTWCYCQHRRPGPVEPVTGPPGE